jgi:hypothetical protein
MKSAWAIEGLTAPTATVCVGAAELEVDDEVEAAPLEELCANPTGIKAEAKTKKSTHNIMTSNLIFRNRSSQSRGGAKS